MFDNADVVTTCTVSGSNYLGVVEGIAAKEVDETVYCAAVFTDADGNTCTSGIIAYSLSKYCIKNATSADIGMQNLAKATAVYGYYAENYFAD